MTSQSPAWILHHYPYGDTSMLLEVLSEHAGRVGVVARGVRRRGSRDRALLEPFQPLLLSWSGRGELKTLTQVDCPQWRRPPVGRNLIAAYYCNELLLRLLRRGQEEPGIFAAYAGALERLRDAGRPQAALRRFELALLDGLGYAPPLARRADTGEALDPAREYDFHPEAGPLPATGPRPESGAVRVPGADLLALARHEFDDERVLQAAGAILRRSLAPHLGGRPLRTRALYRRMYGAGEHT